MKALADSGERASEPDAMLNVDKQRDGLGTRGRCGLFFYPNCGRFVTQRGEYPDAMLKL